MKVTMHWKGLSGFLLLITIVMIACKKDKTAVVSPPVLFGSWTENVPSTSGISPRGLMFSKDSIYFIISDHASQQVTYVQGTYSTQGDKLSANFKEIVVRQDNDRIISKTPVSGSYFENATYLLEKYKLTINYTAYPADGPAPATMTFNRVR